jgi:hypothetical protein
MDVDMYWTTLADDFKCTQTGKLTDIHFWGSFAGDCLPPGGPDSMFLRINIYSDVPAGVDQPFSHPGEMLWTRDLAPCQYSVRMVAEDREEGWFDPATGFYAAAEHFKAFQYNICIDPDDEPFEQEEGTIYWLEIQHVRPDQDPEYTFGWKTTRPDLRFNDDAVYFNPNQGWLPLTYPKGHELEGQTLDLAFVITGQAPPPPDLDFGDAVDPTYPTLLASNGAHHVVDPRIFLGNRIDPEPDGQPDVLSLGDDNDIDPLNPPPNFDDEDGVVFNTPLIPGQPAQVTVTASVGGGFLQAWVDFNNNGSWADANDQIIANAMLAAGPNPLPFQVPPTAVPNVKTFARFRYSTMPRLPFDGGAPNGEVEDYLVDIEHPYIPKPPTLHVKWSQPPIEKDMVVPWTPTYCGWDEPSLTDKPLASEPAFWRVVADDFRCLGRMPITSIHWWGSYQLWQGLAPPARRPQAWYIAFWSNVPAGVDADYSHPGRLLWKFRVSADRVKEEWVGLDLFPEKPSDTCFQYNVELNPEEYFWQNRFVSAGAADTVFWISITAYYRGFPQPEFIWGWKTRPAHWMDDAVTFPLSQDDLKDGQVIDPTTITPIEGTFPCGEVESFDMAFELDTDPNYIKWEQPFTGLRDWPHYEDEKSYAFEEKVFAKWHQPPDLEPTGVDVDMYWVPLADDFRCNLTGPIEDISIWGSFAEDKLPANGPGSLTLQIKIYSDIPQAGAEWSRPGKVLWGPRVFRPGDYTVTKVHDGPEDWYDPATGFYQPANHHQAYRYDFHIDDDPFEQREGTIYWLEVKDLPHPPPDPGRDYTFGWKTTKPDFRWNDDAVFDYWLPDPQPPIVPGWNPLKYPDGHQYQLTTLDLAFEIGTPKAEEIVIQRLVADDWKCRGHTPITAAVWWGSYVGYTRDVCTCQPLPQARPVRPDYFLLSIWSDVPANADDPDSFSHPGKKLWEYRAYEYDEVLVGFDKHPEFTQPGQAQAREPVFRYSVRLPQERWFGQRDVEGVYWFSAVAVYKDPRNIRYPWGWTNHRHMFNDDAVGGTIDPAAPAPQFNWEPLYDQTGVGEDMSFVLFTEPGCFPSWYSTYGDWLALGKPNCWCGIYGNPQWPYQCDGDADNKDSGIPFKFQVFTSDLSLLVANWKKKIDDPTLDPCADFDHKDSGIPFHFRVFTADLATLVANWKKKAAQLPGNCPRPE